MSGVPRRTFLRVAALAALAEGGFIAGAALLTRTEQERGAAAAGGAPAQSPAATVEPEPQAVQEDPGPPAPEPSPPLALDVSLQPAVIPQGGVSMLVVHANQPIELAEAHLPSSALAIDWNGAVAWAFIGVEPEAATGSRTVSTTITGAGGDTASATAPLRVVAAAFPVEEIWIPPSQSGEENPLAPGVMSSEWAQLLRITSRVTPQRYWTQPFVPPTDAPISSVFGTRRSYNGGPAGEPHQGTDFAAAYGSPIVAGNTGIAHVYKWTVRGNAVLIDHGLGLWSGYYHMSEVLVADGDWVERGQQIGRAGATGMATGPHVHWDVIVQSAHTDGMLWTQIALPA